LLAPLRRVMNPAVLDSWVRLRARLTVSGLEHLASAPRPVIFAAAGHEHSFDVLLIHAALPRAFRRKLALVASRWVFRPFLEPEADASSGERWLVALGFKLLVPLFFPFALSSHFGKAREGLLQACRLADRGFSLIAFEGGGLGVVARECGIPLIPVRIDGNVSIGFAPHFPRHSVSVTFGKPVDAAAMSEEEMRRLLQDFYPPEAGD
jgi:1-acyl-sn-glycerol-3-phosphate acyltransferase